MALIHEATGIVLHDPKGELRQGQEMVLLPCKVEEGISEDNYRRDAFFRSSNADGFCQEMLTLGRRECIPIPAGLSHFFVFSEVLSVCCHGLRRLKRVRQPEKMRVGIWGDGIMGYAMALVIRILQPDWELLAFGCHEEKLAMFSFADKRINILEKHKEYAIDLAIECVGGAKAETALSAIIRQINPHGAILLMGVSELPVRLDTRKILEKGLVLAGTSRSARCDFEQAVALIANRTVRSALQKVISHVVRVRSHLDLYEAFWGDRKRHFKTLIELTL